MKNAKESKGITLISLIIMIIILTTLGSIAVYSGTGTIRYGKYMKVQTEMKTLQSHIDGLYQEYRAGNEAILTYGTAVTYNDYKDEFEAASVNSTIATNYRLYTNSYIKDTLRVDGIESNYLVNIIDRQIILVGGLKYESKMNYTMKDFGLADVVAYDPISSVSFELARGNNPNKLEEEVIFVYNLKFYDSEGEVNVSKYNIEYSLDGTNWTKLDTISRKMEYNVNDAYGIKIQSNGTYRVRIKDRNGNIIENGNGVSGSIVVSD